MAVETTQQEQFDILQISETKPLIGREVYDATEVTSYNPRQFYEEMRMALTPDLAKALESRLHNNSYVTGQRYFGSKRPASSYFTYFDEKVLIEWGMIDPTGNAKLHDYLNEELRVTERHAQGATVLSGHIADVTLPNREEEVRVALFDAFSSDKPLDTGSLDFNIAVTLINHNILPVTTDGFPVPLKAYKPSEPSESKGRDVDYTTEGLPGNDQTEVARQRAPMNRIGEDSARKYEDPGDQDETYTESDLQQLGLVMEGNFGDVHCMSITTDEESRVIDVTPKLTIDNKGKIHTYFYPKEVLRSRK